MTYYTGGSEMDASRVKVEVGGKRYLVCFNRGEATVFGRVGGKWSCGVVSGDEVRAVLSAVGFVR